MTSLGYRPCAGVVLVNGAGLVFAGRRNDRPAGAPAAWQMPQGGVDEGDDLVTAALRELEEETGSAFIYDATSDSYVCPHGAQLAPRPRSPVLLRHHAPE